MVVKEQQHGGATGQAINENMQKIVMFAFYTDGGAHSNSMTYYIHKIFDTGQHLYSTKAILDPLKQPVHLQGYGGRAAMIPTIHKSMKEYEIDAM